MSDRRMICAVLVTLAIGPGCAKKQQVQVAAPTPAAPAVVTPAPAAVAEVTPVPGTPSALRLDPIYFDFDKAIIHDEDQAILDGIGRHLIASPERAVLISGHCDERGTVEYNIALGDRRANAAREYLVRLGVAPERIRTISYGEAQPADPGHDEAAWARNRRDEFAVEAKQASR
jgi:peptidoglycan-associated lipoprotein